MNSPSKSPILTRFGSLFTKVSKSPDTATDVHFFPSPTSVNSVVTIDPTESLISYYSHPQMCFKRYELMTEFINLSNSSHCPPGIYMMPCADTLNVWYGVMFLHHGFYSSGVFKFRIAIPENYPHGAPSVTFLTDVFHPLIDSLGNLSLSQAFPTWRPYQDYLIHLLHYIKNIFKKSVLDELLDKHCVNREAYRLYREDLFIFRKLAQQCAQLSITESYLFDHFPDNNLIRFSPLDEHTYDKLKLYLLQNTAQ